MKKKSLLSLAFVLVISIVVAGVWAAPGTEFSADMKTTDAKGKVTTGKIFFTTQKIRQELVEKGETMVIILRMDKKLSWTLISDNQYMEMKLQFDPSRPDSDSKVQYETKTIGSETVNGYVCTVIQYTYKDKKLGSTVQWVADKLGFPIKTESRNSSGKVLSITEYTNIKVGKQPDSLFELPAGYQKLGLPF